jgi:protein TonB
MARTQKSASRHLIGFTAVVLLHVGIIWALKAGLATSLVELVKGPMETKMIEEEKVEKEAPPPPPPKFEAPPPAAAIPVDIDVQAAIDTSSDTAISTSNKKQAPAAPPATIPPRSNPRHPVSQPEYPPTSKRLGEAGTVVLLLTVDESGKVVDAKIQKSSGFERLDQAAMQEALRNWRLLPGTVGGKPSQMTYPFAVTFKITD